MRSPDFHDLPAATAKTRKRTIMFSRGRIGVDARRSKLLGTREAIDRLVTLADGNPDKALVMTYIGELVVAGYGELEMLENGEVEACFTSGETYLLAETTILRLA